MTPEIGIEGNLVATAAEARVAHGAEPAEVTCLSAEWKDPIVRALLISLSDKRYAILHGWESLHEGPTSDVDIVIARDDLAALERALRRGCGASIAQVIRYEGGCGFFFVAVRETDEGPAFTQIDAATAYSRDGRILLDSHELLDRRWVYHGRWVVRPEAEFAYLLNKKICKRHFPSHQRDRLSRLSRALDGAAVQVTTDILGGEAALGLVDDIVGGDWSKIESRIELLHKHLLIKASQRHRWNFIRYWSAELARALWRLRNPTGLLVAVLGPDGSGKSSLIESLKSKARPLFWWEAAVFHFRPDVWGTTRDRGPVAEPHKARMRSRLGSILKLGYYAADFAIGYVNTIRPELTRSRLVLFDRYFHDLLVDQRRYRYSGPGILTRLVGHLVPSPDLFLILDAPEETVHRRKQELPLDELRRQRLAYRNLGAGLRSSILLDGSATPAEIVRSAHRHIIDRMIARYEERRHAWFGDSPEETLRWLSLALSQGNDSYISTIRCNAANARGFHWLRLADGRGYLLPADSKSAAAYGLKIYRPQRMKSIIAKTVLKATFRLGIGPRLLPRVEVAARSSGGTVSGIFDYLEGVLGRQLRYAVSMGTPGPHRKPVIQLMEADGHPFAFAKIGWNPVTSALVRNEAETYRRLAASTFKAFDHPELVHSSNWGSHFVAIQSGRPSASRAPTTIESYVLFATELSRVRTVRMPFRESAFGKELMRQVEAGTSGRYGWLIREATKTSLDAIRDRSVSFHPAHGDLTPWNACRSGRTLYLFDWEYSRWSAPAGWDLFHFFLQTNVLLARRSASAIVDRFAAFENSIEPYVHEVQIASRMLKPLFLLYIAEQLLQCQIDPAQHLDRQHLLSSLASVLSLQCQEDNRRRPSVSFKEPGLR